MEPSNEGLKVVCSFFAGLILSGIGAFVAYPHDLPTKGDVANVQATTQAQLATLQSTQTNQEAELTTVRIQLARISAKLNVPEN